MYDLYDIYVSCMISMSCTICIICVICVICMVCIICVISVICMSCMSCRSCCWVEAGHNLNGSTVSHVSWVRHALINAVQILQNLSRRQVSKYSTVTLGSL